jgi:hypothetical protein
MKNLIFIIGLVLISLGANAQRLKGTVETVTSDTVKGNETIYLTTATTRAPSNIVTINLGFEQIGGTTDGTVVIQGSVDGSTKWTDLISAQDVFTAMPNDTVTMTSGGTATFIIKGNPWNKYRAKVAGTASDTTAITFDYTFK